MWIHRGWMLLPQQYKMARDPEYILEQVTFPVVWVSVGLSLLD